MARTDWLPIECPVGGGEAWVHMRTRLFVIKSLEVHDNETWCHVSVSGRGRLPTWEELRAAKNEFIGRERLAVQVLPPESEYVNCHPYVLHLWSRTHGPRLVPDFRDEMGLV